MNFEYITDYIHRKIEEIPQKQLAKELGVAQSSISRYKNEASIKDVPSFYLALAIWKLDKVAVYPYSKEALQIAEDRGE